MSDLDTIIKKCEIYIKTLHKKNNKNDFEVQYYEMALEIQDLLVRLRNHELDKVPESFYMNLVDSFDIYSVFWKDFRSFQNNNPIYFE